MACGVLGCGEVPALKVVIFPYIADQPKWDPITPNTLIVPSPLASGDRTRSDRDISSTLEDTVAKPLADRLLTIATNNVKVVQTADLASLRQSALEWLAATFVGRPDATQVNFIQSVNEHYGAAGVTALVHALTPTSDISIVGIALKQPIESLALDWRNFFQWRVGGEEELIFFRCIMCVQRVLW